MPPFADTVALVNNDLGDSTKIGLVILEKGSEVPHEKTLRRHLKQPHLAGSKPSLLLGAFLRVERT